MTEIVLDDVTKIIRGKEVISHVSLSMHSGRIYGFQGINGSGKTMLMRLIAGLVRPTSGSVRINEKVLWKDISFPESVGILLENPAFLGEYSAYQNLRLLASVKKSISDESIKKVISCVGLEPESQKKYKKFSLGMKQRLAIALAVMHDPELLILDEPINGLDPIGIAEVRSFIRRLCDERGKTILLSSHILSEIALLADDIGILDHGTLLEEESLAELESKSSRHIHFTLSDAAQAARILEHKFHENHFTIQDDHNLQVDNLDISVAKLVTAFVTSGLEVSDAHTCEESLEDYFKRVTGGEGIA